MIEILVLVLIILIIIAVTVYFYKNFTEHEEENVTDFNKVKNEILTEKETRASNLAYVVQQVNEKNRAMDSAHMNEIKNLDNNLEDIITRYNTFERGFGTIIQTTNKDTGETVPLANNPVPVDIELLKHVSALGGMTIKDLQNDKRFKACGTGADSARCIEFPNGDGDTYLTSFTDGKSIIAGAPLKTQQLDVTGALSVTGDLGLTGDLSVTGELRMSSGTTPTEFMKISSDAAGNALINSNKFRLSATGVELPSSVTLTDSTNTAIITLDPTGSLNISAPNNINLSTGMDGVVKINGVVVPPVVDEQPVPPA